MCITSFRVEMEHTQHDAGMQVDEYAILTV